MKYATEAASTSPIDDFDAVAVPLISAWKKNSRMERRGGKGYALPAKPTED